MGSYSIYEYGLIQEVFLKNCLTCSIKLITCNVCLNLPGTVFRRGISSPPPIPRPNIHAPAELKSGSKDNNDGFH